MGTLLGLLIFFIGWLIYPYFPSEIPASSANIIIQSMIEVNGVIFAFSAIITGILSLNPTRQVNISVVFSFLFGALVLFFGAIFFDVLDLANMGTSIGRFYLLRDVLMPIYYGLAVIYLIAQSYREFR